MLGWFGENYGNKTERILIVILIILICIILVWQCFYLYYFKDIQPYCQNNTKWVSENPNICIEVKEEFVKTTGGNTVAKIQLPEGEKESDVLFDNVNRVYFLPMYYDITKEQAKTQPITELNYISGECKFYRDKMVVKIEEDHIFNGEYDKITFIKEPLE